MTQKTSKNIENHESIFAIQHHVSPYLHSCSCKEWATNQYLTRSSSLFCRGGPGYSATTWFAASCSFIIRMIRMRISKANSMCFTAFYDILLQDSQCNSFFYVLFDPLSVLSLRNCNSTGVLDECWCIVFGKCLGSAWKCFPCTSADLT